MLVTVKDVLTEIPQANVSVSAGFQNSGLTNSQGQVQLADALTVEVMGLAKVKFLASESNPEIWVDNSGTMLPPPGPPLPPP